MVAATRHPVPDSSPDETRSRLLEAAGQVFAERGFHSATVRDICKIANANVAAIHYHFGDKESLYTVVLRESYKAALKKYPPLLDTPASAPPAERLRAFIQSLLFRVLDEGRPAWHGKLMLREMAEPTSALDDLVKQGIRPLFELLSSIVRDVICSEFPGSNPPPALVAECVQSIIGQCTFYKFTQPVLERLRPASASSRTVPALAEHISEFSLHGIFASARRAKLVINPRRARKVKK